MKLFRHFKAYIQNCQYTHVHWKVTLSLYQNKPEVNNILLNYQPHSNNKMHKMLLTVSHSHWHIYTIHTHTCMYTHPCIQISFFCCALNMYSYLQINPYLNLGIKFTASFSGSLGIFFLILLYRDTLQGIKKQKQKRWTWPARQLPLPDCSHSVNLFPSSTRFLLFFL